jgi:hypothetical protein
MSRIRVDESTGGCEAQPHSRTRLAVQRRLIDGPQLKAQLEISPIVWLHGLTDCGNSKHPRPHFAGRCRAHSRLCQQPCRCACFWKMVWRWVVNEVVTRGSSR